MPVVNMHKAKSTLSKLVADIESGREKEIVLARNGKPTAKLIAADVKRNQIILGVAKGQYGEFDYEAFQALDAEAQKMFDESV